ncbi:MAG: hypothetical protein PSV33_04805 [Polaromonas sp.]|nr:hypothetical protein [Polaromonas sp.]MDI1272867.1 hypothetical protein [Polaromonas sp.]
METYDSTLMPRFSQMLVQRETELRAPVRATAKPTRETGGTGQHCVMGLRAVARELAIAWTAAKGPICGALKAGLAQPCAPRARPSMA